MSEMKLCEAVLGEFLPMTEIPRPSHHEERISKYLFDWAVSRGLHAERDELGEVIIDKPASPGCENVPRLIMQAHMDMVCVAAEGGRYDPLTDGVKAVREGDTLRAEGTSLGADNGIGVAMALCMLKDPNLKHGPLRAVFTVNEEDGMASIGLAPEYLEGDYLINLDWETLGSLCNSCAGGDYFNFSRDAQWEDTPKRSVAIELGLAGFLGGHSGVGIHLGHANALVSAATALEYLRQNGVEFRVASFSGGQAKNAIPASANAVITLTVAETQKAMDQLEAFKAEFYGGYRDVEPSGVFTFSLGSAPERVMGEAAGYSLVGLMSSVPNDVFTMSPFIPGLVESSANLGVISLDGRVSFTVFARSSSAYRAMQTGIICRSLASAYGFELDSDGHVPGWAVNPNSVLTKIACEQYKRLTGEDMVVEPVHAGVECGAFAEKNPKLDMIAIGPTLMDVHTPNETCNLPSVEITMELLRNIIQAIADRE